MSPPFPLVTTLVLLLILVGYQLADAVRGYACPCCGARSENRHARHCPWSR